MKKFLLTLTLMLTLAATGVMYALPLVKMVETPTLVQSVEGRLEGRKGDRLAGQNQRFTRNHRRNSGLRGITESTVETNCAESIGAEDTFNCDQPLRQDSADQSLRHDRTGPAGQYPGTEGTDGNVNGGWFDSPADKVAAKAVGDCPHPNIEKNGDANKNYAVIFTASWCFACPPSKKAMRELHEAGYIVYFIDYDEYRKEFGQKRLKELGVFAIPSVLVYDQGKIVKRIHKPTDIRLLKNSMKTAAEQKEVEKPTDPDYILRDSDHGTHSHIRGRTRCRQKAFRR